MAEQFETFSPAQLAENPLFKAEEKKPDETWTQRISGVALGSGFRVHRTEGESTRQLKRRINAAAGSEAAGFKTLEWKPEDRKLPDGFPASYIVKVKAIDLKAKAEAEANRQNAQNGTSQGQETTDGSNPVDEGTATEGAAQGRVRGR